MNANITNLNNFTDFLKSLIKDTNSNEININKEIYDRVIFNIDKLNIVKQGNSNCFRNEGTIDYHLSEEKSKRQENVSKIFNSKLANKHLALKMNKKVVNTCDNSKQKKSLNKYNVLNNKASNNYSEQLKISSDNFIDFLSTKPELQSELEFYKLKYLVNSYNFDESFSVSKSIQKYICFNKYIEIAYKYFGKDFETKVKNKLKEMERKNIDKYLEYDFGTSMEINEDEIEEDENLDNSNNENNMNEADVEIMENELNQAYNAVQDNADMQIDDQEDIVIEEENNNHSDDLNNN